MINKQLDSFGKGIEKTIKDKFQIDFKFPKLVWTDFINPLAWPNFIGSLIWENIIPSASGIFDGLKLSIKGFIDWINTTILGKFGMTMPGGSNQPPEVPPTPTAQWKPGTAPGVGNWIDPTTGKTIFTATTTAINDISRSANKVPGSGGENTHPSTPRSTPIPGVTIQPVLTNALGRTFEQQSKIGDVTRLNSNTPMTLPGIASGGFISQGGLALLHSGERIQPAHVARGDSGGNVFYLNLGGIRIDKVSSEMDLNRLLSLIDKQAQKSIKNALAQRRT